MGGTKFLASTKMTPLFRNPLGEAVTLSRALEDEAHPLEKACVEKGCDIAVGIDEPVLV